MLVFRCLCFCSSESVVSVVACCLFVCLCCIQLFVVMWLCGSIVFCRVLSVLSFLFPQSLVVGGLLLLDYDLVAWLLLLERARCIDASC